VQIAESLLDYLDSHPMSQTTHLSLLHIDLGLPECNRIPHFGGLVQHLRQGTDLANCVGMGIDDAIQYSEFVRSEAASIQHLFTA
jgi:hypothetical protein